MRIDRAVIEKVSSVSSPTSASADEVQAIGFEFGDELWAHSESRIVVEIVGGRETDEKAVEVSLPLPHHAPPETHRPRDRHA
jgi:hypothetical protein